MTPEEDDERIRTQYWGQLCNYIDQWLVHPRPLQETQGLQAVGRNAQIEYARLVARGEEVAPPSRSFFPIDPLIQTQAVSKMAREYRNRYNRRRNKMLRLMLPLLKVENIEGRYDRVLSHLTSAGVPVFYDLLGAVPNERIKSIYQAKSKQDDSVEGLKALAARLDALGAEQVVLHDLAFEDAWFLVFTNDAVTSLIGLLSGTDASRYQFQFERGSVPESMPSLL